MGPKVFDTGQVKQEKRAAVLKELLQDCGLELSTVKVPAPRWKTLPDEARNDLVKVFAALGGKSELKSARGPGAWDITLSDGLVIELDEQAHFNRYRVESFNCSSSSALPWRTDYLGYCASMEMACLKSASWGKYWTTTTCETMFGPSTVPKSLEGAGSARWKQRALYDSMKDLGGIYNPEIRVARLSIYDTVGNSSLDEVLKRRVSCDSDDLLCLVRDRTI